MSKEKHPGYTNVKLACGHVLSLVAVPWFGDIQMFGEKVAYDLAKTQAAEQAKKYVCAYGICRAKHGLPVHDAILPDNTTVAMPEGMSDTALRHSLLGDGDA